MGATNVEVVAYGKNIQDAFRNAQEAAREEYGHQQGYSGEINCCELVKDVTSKKSNMHIDELEEYIYSNVDKREVMGYCEKQPKLNNNKIKTQVKNFPNQGTRTWKTVYKAFDSYGSFILEANTQTECIKLARRYVEQQPNSKLTIAVHKDLVKGQQKCAEISYKKAAGESLGKYVFIGIAPC